MSAKKRLVASIAKKYYIAGADFDDILQEAMIGLYKAIISFDHDKNSNFDAFIVLCIKRRLSTAVKNSKRKKHIPLNDYVSFDSQETLSSTVAASDPSKSVMDRERIVGISRFAKKRLSPFEYQVFLCCAEGYSYRKTARVLGRDIKAVDNAVSRIRNKLKSDISRF